MPAPFEPHRGSSPLQAKKTLLAASLSNDTGQIRAFENSAIAHRSTACLGSLDESAARP